MEPRRTLRSPAGAAARAQRRPISRIALAAVLMMTVASGCNDDPPLAPAEVFFVSASGTLESLDGCCPHSLRVTLDGSSTAWDTVVWPQPRGAIFWSTTQAAVRPGTHTIELSLLADPRAPSVYRLTLGVKVEDRDRNAVFHESLDTREQQLAVSESVTWSFTFSGD